MDFFKTKFFSKRSESQLETASNSSQSVLLGPSRSYRRNNSNHKPPITSTPSHQHLPFNSTSYSPSSEDSSNGPLVDIQTHDPVLSPSGPGPDHFQNQHRESEYSIPDYLNRNQNQHSTYHYTESSEAYHQHHANTNQHHHTTSSKAHTQTTRTTWTHINNTNNNNTSHSYKSNNADNLQTSNSSSFTNFSGSPPIASASSSISVVNRASPQLSGPSLISSKPHSESTARLSTTSLTSSISLASSASLYLGEKRGLYSHQPPSDSGPPLHTNTQGGSKLMRLRKALGSNQAENQIRLMRLLLRPDLAIVQAICNSILYEEEVNQMATCLITLFQNQGLGLALIQQIIHVEIAKAEDEGTLLRNTSAASILMSAYVRMNCHKYLSLLFKPLIHHLLSSRISIEIDPNRLEAGEDLTSNLANLFRITRRFLDEICSSVEYCPRPIRLLSRVLQEEVNEKFPGSAQTSMGGFFFLRFLCPAIVTPDAYNIIPPSALSKGSRRSLILISKVLQSLTNGVPFGDKEDYMIPLNQFILDNTQHLTEFFDSLTAIEVEDHPTRCGNQVLKSTLVFLSDCLHRYRPRIEEQLNIIIENNGGPLEYDPFEVFSFFLSPKNKKKKQKSNTNPPSSFT